MSTTERGQSPLMERLQRFSRVIAVVVLVAAVIIGAIGVLVNEQSVATMFAFGVALAGLAIPEGLPVAVTGHARNRGATHGETRRNRAAPACVEGLGSCTLIASDKTGTLTCNELTVREVQVASPACSNERRGLRAERPHRAARAGDRGWTGAATRARDRDRLQRRRPAPSRGRVDRRGDPTTSHCSRWPPSTDVDREEFLARWPGESTRSRSSDDATRELPRPCGCRPGSPFKGGAGARVRHVRLASAAGQSAQAAAMKWRARGLRVMALASGELPGNPRPLRSAGRADGPPTRALVGLIDRAAEARAGGPRAPMQASA